MKQSEKPMDSIISLSWWSNKRFQLISALLITLGIIFRLLMFIQNRNLVIDESNIVWNIYSRDFIGLLKPLDHEQYAPPLYLWCVELCSLLFGYSEQSMRLTALILGIASLFIFRILLKRIIPEQGYWLTLGLFCFAPILVKYSTEVKQYVPDAFVAIILVLVALKWPIFVMPKKKFILHWILAGSIVIWASQPSVFILASIGAYYFIQCFQLKKREELSALLFIGIIWLAQFGVYYIFILKSQINSDYLQSYHNDYFLFALPKTGAEWRHNWLRVREILCNTAGFNMVSLYLCAFFILIGGISLFRQSLSKFVLFSFPVLLTLIAAALHQFSLIERVIIFILPFTMILLGFGFAQLIKIPLVFSKILLVGCGIYILYLYNYKSLFIEKANFYEVTVGMDYLMNQNAKAKEIFVDRSTKDAYYYYTQIHPSRRKYAAIKDAYLIDWHEKDYYNLAKAIETQRSFLIFTGGSEEERNELINPVKEFHKQKDFYQFAICYVFTFEKK